jgi:hypothetical protein
MRRFVVFAVAVTSIALVGTAHAQAPEDEAAPAGYKFCGWRGLGEEKWCTHPPEPGAWERVWARRMTCRQARRNAIACASRASRPTHRPVLKGYRCRVVDQDSHFTDVRCRKRGSKATLRWQSGS